VGNKVVQHDWPFQQVNVKVITQSSPLCSR